MIDMQKLTMAQAQAVAELLDASTETLASNGADGMLSFCVPSFTKADAEAFITTATQGFDLDWRSVFIVQDKLEDSDLPLVTITITTLEK